jgi:hypothetical protein
MKRYCLDCGAPTEYSLKKPIFCTNCGNSFEKNNQASQIIVKNIEPQKPTIVKKINKLEAELEDDIDYNDDDQDVKEVPNISNLQIEAPLDKPTRGVKLKDLMGTSTNENSKKERKKGKKVSKKQILEDFAKEAGSLRKNKR